MNDGRPMKRDAALSALYCEIHAIEGGEGG